MLRQIKILTLHKRCQIVENLTLPIFCRSSYVVVGALFAPSFLSAQSALEMANHAIQQPVIDTKLAPAPTKKPIVETSAESAQPVPQTVGGGIFIGAISVEGAHNIESSAFSSALEPFVAKQLASDDMQRLCHALADVARQQGYSFASAYIPPQELALGVLRVVVDEGMVNAVRVTGSSDKHLIATMNKLVGHAPTASETERQILLASDIPGVALEKISFVRESGQGILLVRASETRVKGVVSVDNGGTSSLGPVRVSIAVDVDSLLVGGDVLTVAAVTTPTNPKELGFVALKYALPIDADGTVLSFSSAYGQTRPGGVLEQFDVRGRSIDFGVSLSRPLLRNRKSSLTVSGGFDYLESSQDILGLPLNDDHLATAWVTLSGSTDLFGGRLRSELTLTQGLPLFGATRLGDPLASRADGSAVFTKESFFAEWTGTVSGPISMRLAARAQLASGPLLSAQQITFGGTGFGRAFETSTMSGDEGALGLAEVRSDINHPFKWIDWAQPYVFVDGGKLRYIGDYVGGGALVSGGGGFRARIGKSLLSVESAFPITADPLETDGHKPRFNFQIAHTF